MYDAFYLVFNKPFKIKIYVCDLLDDEGEGKDEEEYDEETILTTRKIENNTNKIFKSDRCVKCLIFSPNILFCNCGHVPICVECEEMEPLKICPTCKTYHYIKRKYNQSDVFAILVFLTWVVGLWIT